MHDTYQTYQTYHIMSLRSCGYLDSFEAPDSWGCARRRRHALVNSERLDSRASMSVGTCDTLSLWNSDLHEMSKFFYAIKMTNIIKHVVNVVLIKILNKTSEDPAWIPENCWHKDSNFTMSAFACFCQVHRTWCSPFKQSFRRSALPGALDTAKFMFLLLRRPFPLTLSLWSGIPPPRCKKSSRLRHSQSRVNMTSSNKRQLLGWQIKSCWIMLNHELTALNSISCPVAGEWASLPLGF